MYSKICRIDSDVLHKMVIDELALHPHSDPVDLYKLLYQALYGPFHIVRDFKQLCSGIASEFWSMQDTYEPLYQRIGPCYTRLSLSSIKRDGDTDKINLRIEYLARWILDSCILFEDVSRDFLRRWQEIRPIIQQELPSTSYKWQQVDELAVAGRLPSHSTIFHKHYHPSYRLVDAHLSDHIDKFMEIN